MRIKIDPNHFLDCDRMEYENWTIPFLKILSNQSIRLIILLCWRQNDIKLTLIKSSHTKLTIMLRVAYPVFVKFEKSILSRICRIHTSVSFYRQKYRSPIVSKEIQRRIISYCQCLMNKAEILAIDQLVFEVEWRSNRGRNLNIELVHIYFTFKNVIFPYKSNIFELYIKQRRKNFIYEGLQMIRKFHIL